MGGGPVNPVLIKDQENDVNPLRVGVNALTVDDSQYMLGASVDAAIKVDDTDIKDEDENVDMEVVPPKTSKVKILLARELKALYPDWKPPNKPDYTKELDEPSWGDSEDEDDEADGDNDEDMDDQEGVLDGEDIDYDDDEVEEENN